MNIQQLLDQLTPTDPKEDVKMAGIKATRASNLGRKHSAEAKAKMSAGSRGKPKPALQGRPLKEETKAKLREALLGNERSAETRAKIAQAMKGKTPHANTIAAASQPRSEATKAKIAATRSKPCTVDGITIYPSRKALAEALGRYSEGAGHPNFRYVP